MSANGNEHVMPHVVRPMREEDIAQVSAIDREVFSETWPPPSFRNELRNKLARYFVAWDTRQTHRSWAQKRGTLVPAGAASAPSRLASTVRRFFVGEHPQQTETEELLTGYIGLWLVLDEAHITSVGVRPAFRGQGIGELLLLGAAEMSILENCRQMTLECRVSNAVAQSLYAKYGFHVVGRRKAYYVDNREDAFIMTTDVIDTPVYRQKLQALREAHSHRWGVSTRYLV